MAAMGASLLKLDDVGEGHVPQWGQCLLEANHLIHPLALGKIPPLSVNGPTLTM